MSRRKGRKKPVRHRSPLPPPSRVIDKIGYRRNVEKERLRRQLKEEG